MRTLLGISWNYLRVRGEYPVNAFGVSSQTELPPRARRILTGSLVLPRIGGTTSACAENTANTIRPTQRRWNYLRVRGEYFAGFD